MKLSNVQWFLVCHLLFWLVAPAAIGGELYYDKSFALTIERPSNLVLMQASRSSKLLALKGTVSSYKLHYLDEQKFLIKLHLKENKKRGQVGMEKLESEQAELLKKGGFVISDRLVLGNSKLVISSKTPNVSRVIGIFANENGEALFEGACSELACHKTLEKAVSDLLLSARTAKLGLEIIVP